MGRSIRCDAKGCGKFAICKAGGCNLCWTHLDELLAGRIKAAIKGWGEPKRHAGAGMPPLAKRKDPKPKARKKLEQGGLF